MSHSKLAVSLMHSKYVTYLLTYLEIHVKTLTLLEILYRQLRHVNL